MNNQFLKKNFTEKTFFLLGSFFLIIYAFHVAQDFLIPLVFAILFSLLLLPVTKWLERKKFPRPLAIIISILLILLILSFLIFLFYSQVKTFAEDVEELKTKFLQKTTQGLKFIEEKTGVSTEEQMNWLEEKGSEMLNGSGEYIKAVIFGVTGFIAILGIIIIYIFFFLFYRERFQTFLLKLFPIDIHPQVKHVIARTKIMVQHYLTGVLLELLALGTLNAVGLLIIGIKQAIFLGYLAGFLNIVPYVGTLIGSIFPVLMALIFEDSILSAIAVVAVLTLNQFIDNNFLTPKIIGSHIQVNPLATIMVIILGGMLWGIPGMILFIPMLGIFKIICDNIESMQPLGYLLGERDEIDFPQKPGPGLWQKLKTFFASRKK